MLSTILETVLEFKLNYFHSEKKRTTTTEYRKNKKQNKTTTKNYAVYINEVVLSSLRKIVLKKRFGIM